MKKIVYLIFNIFFISFSLFSQQQDILQGNSELLINPYLGGTCNIPHIVLPKLTTFGIGPELSIELKNLLFRDSIFSLSIASNFMWPDNDFLNTYLLNNFCLAAGYNFNVIQDILDISLSAGGGYIIHTIDRNSEENDNTPPEVTIQFKPDFFSPDGDGENDVLYIQLNVEDSNPISEWSIRINNPQKNPFITFQGKSIPEKEISWDGRSVNGELVQSTEEYPLILSISDQVGNSTIIQDIILVDILIVRQDNQLKINIPTIEFNPYTDDYIEVGEELAEKNLRIIRRLASVFKKHKEYSIRIEGHALNIYYDDPQKAKTEHEEILLPLSKQRAEAIKQALVVLGIDKERITTAGFGSARPLFPFSDIENRWKNRRVEFILFKEMLDGD